jgi:hypothetical protein
MRTWLPIGHLALTAVILAWNIALAGRISQVRKAPRAFAGITALCGFLVAPALALSVAASSAITGPPCPTRRSGRPYAMALADMKRPAMTIKPRRIRSPSP